jgi:general nucleoside transport system ATP-binding protein
MTVAVGLYGITKRFGEVTAIDDASFEVARGEIHALLGENGAGKTSLMNVLAGLYRPEAGQIHLDGQPVAIHSPEDAKRLGIGMVHQEQRLVARFTAPENVAIGHREPGWLVLQRYFRALAARLSTRYRLPIDAEHPIWSLPLGRRQRVELVKLLHHGARVIILDEPTANLAPAEIETFFDAVRQLARAGRTVIFITHKLDEVIRYTDRVTIMRAGRVVAAFPTAETSRERLNRLMVGAAPAEPTDAPPEPAGAPEAPEGTEGTEPPRKRPSERVVLDVRGLTIRDPAQRVSPHDVTCQVRAGEVFAIAGVAGNGQTQLAEAITGHIPGYTGSIRIAGRELRGLGPRAVADLGVGYVPENRGEGGLIAGQSVAVNLALRRYDRLPFSRNGWVDYRAIRHAAIQLIERYGIQPPDPDAPAGRLSGGNQQRVILAREFSGSGRRLLVVDNFTRGLDPRSTQQFTEGLFEHRNGGAAVVWITGDLAEALLCDRIGVMNRGRLVAVLERAEATRERLGLLMSGDVAERVA